MAEFLDDMRRREAPPWMILHRKKGKERCICFSGADNANDYCPWNLFFCSELKVYGIDKHPDSLTVIQPTARQTLESDTKLLLFQTFLRIYECSRLQRDPNSSLDPDAELGAAPQNAGRLTDTDMERITRKALEFARGGVDMVESEWAPRVRWADLMWAERSSRLITDRLERMW